MARALAVWRSIRDDHTTDGGAMPADVLGDGVHHDIGPPFDRSDQIGGGNRVVHDQRNAHLMGHSRDRFDVENVAFRIGDRLAEEGLGIRPHGIPPRLGIIGIGDEGHLNPQLGKRVVKQVVGAFVERRAGDDVIADLGQIQDRDGFRGLAAGQQQGTHPALERSDALFHRCLGGVHDPGVNIA
jgi:hypothetical protein